MSPHFPDHYVWKHWPYKAVPDPKVSPPEPDYDKVERNIRNEIREGMIAACHILLDGMDDLRWGSKKYKQNVEGILNELKADLEEE